MPKDPLGSIRISVSGVLSIEDAAGGEIGPLSRRAQGLLAFLALQPGMRAERAFLADLLWSDRGPDQARASLRQELSALRRALPEGVLDASRQHVWLDPDLVTLSRGSETLLQGFDLPSEGFEDWLRDARAEPSPEPPEPETAAEFFERPTVLLFAFEALSTSPDDKMIAMSVSEDLRTTLSYWRWFPVIGPDAIGWKTVKDSDLRATAAELGARYAVSGTLMRVGERVRLSASLTDALSCQSIWSDSFDGSMEDIFAFQEEVSRAIVGQIEPQISRAEAARITRTRPESIAPWQLLAMADEIDRKSDEGYGTPEDNFEQERLMREALKIAPDFAPAYARIGRIYFRAALLGWVEDRNAAFLKSVENTSTALRIDPDDWEAHGYNGLARIFGTREYESGIFHGSEAVRLNPSAALARHAAGCGLEWTGEPEKALAHLRFVFRLNPAHPGRAAVLGQVTTCELLVGNKEASIEAARKLMAIAPDYARGLQRCVSTFGYYGVEPEGSAALKRLLELQPDFDEAYVRETYPYAREAEMDVFLEGLRRIGAV